MQTKRTLTNADADFLQKQFSKVFATKDDIKSIRGDIKSLQGTVRDLPTKKDVKNIVLDAINTVIIPGMDNMAEDIKTDLGVKIDSLDRKFISQQNRLDRHNDKIEKLEKNHPQNKHLATI